MRKKLRRSGVWIALAASVIIGGGAGVAYATGAIATGSDDVIVGCAKNENGQLRIVNDASQCLPNEHAVNFAAPQPPPGPQEVVVDCAAGQSVNQALADTAAATQVLITIKGTCTESVNVARGNVALVAAAEGGGLTAPSSGANVLTLNGARNVFVRGLTLSGGRAGLAAFGGASFRARDLHITGAENAVNMGQNSVGNLNDALVENCNNGVDVGQNSSLNVFGGTVSGCRSFGVSVHEGANVALGGGVTVANTDFMGVIASQGGTINLRGATVSNSRIFGAYAFGGSISVGGSETLITGSGFSGLAAEDGGQGSVVGGARIAGNRGGASANNGGSLLIQDGGIVESNTGDGVFLMGGSSLRMRGGAIVRNNSGHGVHASDTSVAVFGDPTNQVVGNGGFGVFCDGPPSVAMMRGNVGTVSGNTSGQISCPNAAP